MRLPLIFRRRQKIYFPCREFIAGANLSGAFNDGNIADINIGGICQNCAFIVDRFLFV